MYYTQREWPVHCTMVLGEGGLHAGFSTSIYILLFCGPAIAILHGILHRLLIYEDSNDLNWSKVVMALFVFQGSPILFFFTKKRNILFIYKKTPTWRSTSHSLKAFNWKPGFLYYNRMVKATVWRVICYTVFIESYSMRNILLACKIPSCLFHTPHVLNELPGCLFLFSRSSLFSSSEVNFWNKISVHLQKKMANSEMYNAVPAGTNPNPDPDPNRNVKCSANRD